MNTKDPIDPVRQRALDALASVQAHSEKARRDLQELSDGWISVATRVVQTGKYSQDEIVADAVTMALHGVAMWASCFLPNGPPSTPPKVEPPPTKVTYRSAKTPSIKSWATRKKVVP